MLWVLQLKAFSGSSAAGLARMQPTSKESGTLPGPTFIPFSVDEYSQLLLWKEFAEAAATVDCLVEVSVFKAEQAGHHISKMLDTSIHVS